jgi:signal transduction histidine kinase
MIWPALRRRFGSVRVRICAAVTVLFAVALTGASVLFVIGVRSSLVSDVQQADLAALEQLRAELQREGRVPDLLSAPASRPSAQMQLVTDTGEVLGATPGLADKPPLVMPGGHPDGSGRDGSQTAGPPPGPAPRAGPPLGGAGAPREPVGFPRHRVIPADQFPGGAPQPSEWAVTAVPASAGGVSMHLIAASPLDEVSRSVDTLTHGLAFAIPVLVLLIGVMSWGITGRALRPVNAITSQVDVITASTLHERVPVPAADDEIAHLARTMNSMLDRLESASTRQRQFVSDASHELRTPVSSIRTELEVALLHPEATDWTEVAGNVLAEDARLERIVGDLLLLARLDEQPDLDRSEDVDLDAVVHEQAARRRPCTVDTTGVHAGRVRGRGEELSRLVGHLLDNACRHARERVEVGVRVADAGEQGSRSGGAVVLTVDDDGPGVPAEQREVVFERFGRLEEGRSRDRGGAGLGLAVVRRIAERHGGSASVGDSPLGGARFEVRLPAAVP